MNIQTYTYNPVTQKVVPRDAIVLDLDAANDLIPRSEVAETAIKALRKSPFISDSGLADQIEAQTKPPRIPEPGLWGVVEASTPDDPDRRKFGRVPSEGDDADQWTESYDEVWRAWSDLIDPVLVRDGIEVAS